MYHFSDTEAVEHDVNTVPGSGDFERVEIDGQWYVPERTCRNVWLKGSFKCSECGATVKLFDESDEPTICVDGVADTPSYCPNCGRKVM